MRIWGIGIVAFAVLAGACSESTSAPDEGSVLNADIAVVAADGALESVSLMGGMQIDGHAPFDGTRSVTCYDEAGAEQSQCDRLTTATMVVAVDMSGEVEREFWSASVERHRELTITGLLGEETTRTFNGGGSETVTRSRHSDELGTRTYAMSGTIAYDDVVVPVPGSDSPWPLSGTITRHVVVTITNGPNGDETIERTVVITFNGTQTATINVNGEIAELDLGTRPGHFPGGMHRGMRQGGRGGRG